MMRKQLTFSKQEVSQLIVSGLLIKGIIKSAINPGLIMYSDKDEEFATFLLELDMDKDKKS